MGGKHCPKSPPPSGPSAGRWAVTAVPQTGLNAREMPSAGDKDLPFRELRPFSYNTIQNDAGGVTAVFLAQE